MARGRWRAPRRLRFSREGKYFVAITLGIGFAAINTGNNLLYLVLGMLLSMIVTSGVLSESVLRALRVARTPPRRVHAGAPALVEIAVRNEKRRLVSMALEVADRPPLPGPAPRCFFLRIGPGERKTARYRVVFPRRGRQRFEGLVVATRFPFGLFRKERPMACPGEVLVYPRLVPVAVPPGGGGGARSDGRPRAARRGDFHALREAREGDDARDIYWRKTAQAGRLLVRQDEEPAGRAVTLRLDNRHDPADPASTAAAEGAIERAASLAAHYLALGRPVALVARGAAIPAAHGPGQYDRLMATLAELPLASAATPFSHQRAAGEVIAVGPGGGAT